MEEALEILWTYARRQPIESNGKTVVASISQSIAAIRIIMRLERWLQKSEEQRSEEQRSEERKVKPSENLKLGYVGEKLPCMEYARPTPARSGKVCESRICEPFAQHAGASLQLVPTNDRACSSSCWCGLITRTPHKLATPTYTPEPLSLPYHEVLAHFASNKAIKSRKPYRMSLRAQVAGLSIQTTCKQKKQRRNAACKVKESKSISPYEYSCAVSHKHSKAAALMLDKKRIRPPCVALIINGIIIN